MARIEIGGAVLELVQGDITRMETDAIVNAANERLAHGGGVAGAIRRAGGPEIQWQSDAWVAARGPVPTGSAAITDAGNLPARKVIHAVGPVYDPGAPERSAELLASAVKSSLALAEEHQLKSVALPAISTGIFGYPLQEAARVMLSAAKEYLAQGTRLERVVFCLYGQPAFDVFAAELSDLSSS